MARKFNLGRQNENLMNDEHYNIYKVMEHYLSPPSGTSNGPQIPVKLDSGANIKSLWMDDYTNPNSADLKYFDGNGWNLLFKNRFKVTENLLNKDEPTDPIDSQLWIDDGMLKYYENGDWKVVRAVPYDASLSNPLGFEDFLIITPMEAAKDQVVDNFSEFLFARTPIVDWTAGKKYEEHEGAIHDLHIYMCKKAHTSSTSIDVTNTDYWVRLDFLNQYLVPSTYNDRFFINGEFIHQKMGWTQSDGITPDPTDAGYSVVTNTCMQFPVDMVDGKLATAVHVNPARLYNVYKKFMMIDKNNPIIEMPEENTEFYGVQGGVGRLLLKTDNPFTTEYFSITSNDTDCIKLNQTVADKFDYIYGIHYEFTTARVKQKGELNKKKFKLQDENYVWIGTVDPDRVCVFAQGLYYEDDKDNYVYDVTTGYLYIKEKLQDYDNIVKTFDFSVLAFPKLYKGMVRNNFDTNLGYRINLPEVPKSKNLLAFAAGVQLHMAGLEVLDDPNGNPLVKYIPSITPDMFANAGEIYWAIAEVDEYNSHNELVHEMWRGRTKAIKKDPYGVVVPIYRDKNNPVNDAIYFSEEDSPLLFVDGVLVFQKEIQVENDYLTIYGLREGQDVVLLGDSKTDNQSSYENSDRLIFEDTISYATIPTELSDTTLVYTQNGLLCDAGSIYTSVRPKDKGYHGEIRLWIDYSHEKWLVYNGYTETWNEIDPTEKVVVNEDTGEEALLIDILDQNARGYTHSRKSISFLQNLGNQVCTYYAYRYADSIEKPLMIDYCYPNDLDGVNNDYPESGEPVPFKINYRHAYTPGKNELTVYLNGVRQNLESPYAVNHSNSKNKECRTDRNNEFTLAIDDGTKMGKAISSYDGYFIYTLEKEGAPTETLIYETEMLDGEKQTHKANGYTVTTLSTPTRNVCFYVIEQCETGEVKACERKVLTFKDSLASKGAYPNNIYETGEFLLTRGNIRVFINGIRQPFGQYQTMELIAQDATKSFEAYKILDGKTIQFNDVLIGGVGGNEGDEANPLFPIGDITLPDGTTERAYHSLIDEIVIETRKDYKIREVTLPIKDNSGEFTEADGVPRDLFKTKDKIMIYINGLAYGKEYTIENNTLRLLNESVKQQLGNSNRDVITLEWR